jgi:hypothetical protein
VALSACKSYQCKVPGILFKMKITRGEGHPEFLVQLNYDRNAKKLLSSVPDP